MFKFFPISANNVSSGVPDKMIQSIMNGKPPISVRLNILGVLEAWSVATRALKYKDMLGDGDSSTYSAIVESKPYGEDCVPNKLECVGHVQKWVGSRLLKLKSSNKGINLSDGKGLSVKGRLTDAKIDILQNYYDLAIRENLSDVQQMAKAVKASFFHVASTDDKPQHHLCPKGDDSWCGYQRDSQTYKGWYSRCSC